MSDKEYWYSPPRMNEPCAAFDSKGNLAVSIYEALYPGIISSGFLGKKYPKGKTALDKYISISKRFQSTSEYSTPGDVGISAMLFAKVVEMEFPTRGYRKVNGGSIKTVLSDGSTYDLIEFYFFEKRNRLEYNLSKVFMDKLNEQRYQIAFRTTPCLTHYIVKIYDNLADFKDAAESFKLTHENFMLKVQKAAAAEEERRRKQLEYEESERKRIASVTASQANNIFKTL